MRASPLPRQETGTLAIGVTERIAEISGFLQLTMTGLDVRVRQFAVIFNKLGHDHKTAPTPGGAAIRYSLRPVGQRIQVNAGLRRGTEMPRTACSCRYGPSACPHRACVRSCPRSCADAAGSRNPYSWETPVLDEVENTSILKTGRLARYRRSLTGGQCARPSPPCSSLSRKRFSAMALNVGSLRCRNVSEAGCGPDSSRTSRKRRS